MLQVRDFLRRLHPAEPLCDEVVVRIAGFLRVKIQNTMTERRRTCTDRSAFRMRKGDIPHIVVVLAPLQRRTLESSKWEPRGDVSY